MTKTGNSRENRTSLAEGNIEQAAVFVPCMTNNSIFFPFKLANVHLPELVDGSSLLSASLLQFKMLTRPNMSLQNNHLPYEQKSICPDI